MICESPTRNQLIDSISSGWPPAEVVVIAALIHNPRWAWPLARQTLYTYGTVDRSAFARMLTVQHFPPSAIDILLLVVDRVGELLTPAVVNAAFAELQREEVAG